MTRRNTVTIDGALVADAINALDYPALADETWTIWTAGAGKWPDADRFVRYLSRSQTAIMGGFALLTTFPRDAVRFDTELEAQAFLGAQNVLRPQPWHGLRITTVGMLKLLVGFYVEDET